VDDQYETSLAPAKMSRLIIHVGNCVKFGRRIEYRDRGRTSDEVGTAGSGSGPEALWLTAFVKKELGIPLGKGTAVLDKAFRLTLARVAVSRLSREWEQSASPTTKISFAKSGSVSALPWRNRHGKWEGIAGGFGRP
jgi:hypothetical protein